jgi:DNA-binding transcriptional MerR regulator
VRKYTPKLSAETILDIRRMRSEGMLLKQIADRFDISKTAVHNALDEKFSEAREEAIADIEKRLNANSMKRGDGSSRRPHHLEKYHQARRGFHLPDHLENQYFDLLKTGIPTVEAARRLGISCGSS